MPWPSGEAQRAGEPRTGPQTQCGKSGKRGLEQPGAWIQILGLPLASDSTRPVPSLPEPLLGQLSAVDATWDSLLERWVGLACDSSDPIPGTHGKCWDTADGGACGWRRGQVIGCCEPTESSSFLQVPEGPGSPRR